MNTQKAIALRIANLLLERNMTPYSLSVKSGLTKQAISNIINEKYKTVKFDTIIKIADGFEMDYHEFLQDKLLDRKNLDIE